MKPLFSAESPLLYHFNATCEMAVGNGSNNYMAPAFLRQFEQELELTPLYLTGDNDYLLLENPPSQRFLKSLLVLKPHLPRLYKREQLLVALSNNLPLKELNPWGWSPAEHKLLEEFKPFCSDVFLQKENSEWKASHKELYSRKMALGVLSFFLENTIDHSLFIDKDSLPSLCKSIEGVELCMQMWQKIVVKAPWSSSGRGIIILCRGDFHETFKNWIRGVIKSQGYVMVEPLLDKICDLSFHYEIKENSEIRFLGQASFSTTEGGQYIGNNVQAFPMNLPQEAYGILSDDHIDLIQQGLKRALRQSAIFEEYSGVLGVDVLLYKTAEGKYKFQPCLEINLRQNMGTVALAIRNLLPANSKGMWQVKYFTEKGSDVALEFDKQMSGKYPLITENKQMVAGYLPLIEPLSNRKFALYLVLSNKDRLVDL